MALRGHASIQGSTDIPTLYNLLPGYLPMPKAATDTSLQRYIELNESARSPSWSRLWMGMGRPKSPLRRRSVPR